MQKLALIGHWLYRRAENINALMLGVMLAAFLIQVVFRYFFRWPTGWSSELTVIMWLWMVLWGAAFVVTEDEEIRFDLLYGSVRSGVRRAMTIVSAIALIGIYLYSLPAAYDYVTFMKIQSTSYLKIRFDILYSIYIIFSVAVICRYVWLLVEAIRGRAERKNDDLTTGSTL